MDFKKSAAFTMMEILVVVFIIGVLFATLGPRVIKFFGKGAETAVKIKLVNIKDALTIYKMEVGTFPAEREGLRALIENPRPNDDRYKALQSKWPFLEGGMDSLGHNGIDFVYHVPPQKFKDKYRYYELIYPGPTGDENDPEMQHAGA